jgi:2-dehydro-3-deoxygalactonokinase
VAQLIAVDWGTSSLRGALLDEDGRVQEERSSDRGILTVPGGGFKVLFDATFGDWMAARDAHCLIAGMAGSRQGWAEADYCAGPAGPTELAARLRWVVDGRVAIVPGLSVDAGDIPDVMRGEETQVFGALQLLGLDRGVFVLPGTHSKWVRVEAGRIVGFSTLMTGEFYALLRRHSILAKSLPERDDGFDAPAFDRGVADAQRSASLMQTAFGVRTLSLFDRMPAHLLSSYLSGLVIGEELRAQPLSQVDSVVVIGADALTVRYARALAAQGVAAQCLGAAATWRGLHALSIAAGIRAGDG